MKEECILHLKKEGKTSESTFICKYQKLEEIPVFERTLMIQDCTETTYTLNDKIIFVEKGSIIVQLGQYQDIIIGESSMFLIPAGYNLQIKALSDARIIHIRMLQNLNFCDCFSTQSLINEKRPNKEYTPTSIKCNSDICLYLETIKNYIKEDLRCPGFSQLKINELFFLLGHSYPRKELFNFFYLHLSSDMTFSNQVHVLHSQVKNVSELASAMNYSLSGFQKHFKKVFGMPPSVWLAAQKSRMIYNDLLRNIPIKHICEKYNFSSLAHLNSFCYKFFGQSPRQIQKSTKAPSPLAI